MIYVILIVLVVAILVFLQINYSLVDRFAPDGDRRAATANRIVDRGIKKFQTGDHQGALADFNEALRLKPDCALAFYNRGVVMGKLRDRDSAIADLNEAARLSKLQGQMHECRKAIDLLNLLK
jgi:Tfp pilus assembly protein PilF